MSNKIYTKKEISEAAIEWARENMPKDFKYRAEQLKVIIETVYSILNTSSKTNVLQAPTGSGKSIIGIVTASLVYKLWWLTAGFYTAKSSYLIQHGEYSM